MNTSARNRSLRHPRSRSRSPCAREINIRENGDASFHQDEERNDASLPDKGFVADAAEREREVCDSAG